MEWRRCFVSFAWLNSLPVQNLKRSMDLVLYEYHIAAAAVVVGGDVVGGVVCHWDPFVVLNSMFSMGYWWGCCLAAALVAVVY